MKPSRFMDIGLDFTPSRDRTGYKVSILVDDPSSWIWPWAERLQGLLQPYHQVVLCEHAHGLPLADFAFFLGCTRLVSATQLAKSRLNLVVHESDLPQGRGWAPVAWQVVEGRNTIPIVLFEAGEDMDSGPIYLRDVILLDGTEMLPEIKHKQGLKTVEMICRFLHEWPDLAPIKQKGTPSFYTRRTHEHDRLDVYKSLAEHFDHLRIVDNEKYPAWFEFRGRKYKINIIPYDQ